MTTISKVKEKINQRIEDMKTWDKSRTYSEIRIQEMEMILAIIEIVEREEDQ